MLAKAFGNRTTVLTGCILNVFSVDSKPSVAIATVCDDIHRIWERE
jgi:hypothetical protein